MKKISNWVFVSTEDDKYCVKGGIGTYLGVLVNSLQQVSPDTKIHWVSESNSGSDFIESQGNVERHYLSRIGANGDKLNIVEYSHRFEERLHLIVNDLFKVDPSANVVIEAPEWEGLLSDFYRNDDKRVLKVSRNHTPLAVTAEMNSLKISGIFAQQVQKEHQQIERSDLVSCPTEYVLRETIRSMWPEQKALPVPHSVIPNCINTELFYPNKNTRAQAIETFRNHTGLEIEENNYNIFVIGSVEERKGVSHVIGSIPHVMRDIPNARFYFIGHHQKDDGDNLTSNVKLTPNRIYETLSPEYRENVFFTDYVDHDLLPSIMEAGDMFPICYLGDNFPGVVAEIGLSQRPMAALMRGGVPEMISSETGTLAYNFTQTAETSLKLAEHIISHYKDPEKGQFMAEKLRVHLIEKFSDERVAQQMINRYAELLEAKR